MPTRTRRLNLAAAFGLALWLAIPLLSWAGANPVAFAVRLLTGA